MVRVIGVSKHFGAIRAVDGVDLGIASGELFGLIGHNGAGKSTLFKMLLGLITPTRGELLIEGEPVHGRGFRSVRRKIGYLPENVVLYDNLSGLETLRFFARLKGAPATDCARVLEQVGLASASGRRVREYSKGMRQRLGFAQALLGNPRLLFLDEPTVGLDPEGIREFYALLRGMVAQGVTVVLSSHILADIEGRVDRLAIMSAGRVRAIGTVPELRDRVCIPSTIRVQVAAGKVDTVRAALALMQVGECEQRGQQLSLQCGRANKMAVLQALASLPDSVLDLQVREPSLEDVFFELSRTVLPCS
jgi:Cu-processing system ATP-binding protein